MWSNVYKYRIEQWGGAFHDVVLVDRAEAEGFVTLHAERIKNLEAENRRLQSDLAEEKARGNRLERLLSEALSSKARNK